MVESSTASIDPQITMGELLRQFPGAQRALFRRYHIGGCSSCGFNVDETLAGVCSRNDRLAVDDVIQHIVESDSAERAMQIAPQDLSEKLKNGEQINLLDVIIVNNRWFGNIAIPAFSPAIGKRDRVRPKLRQSRK